MIKCPNCRHINLDGNRFCHYCGKPLSSRKGESGNTGIPSKERHRVHAKKKGILLWLLLVLLAVSFFALYVLRSKSKTADINIEDVSSQSDKPALLIQRFQVSALDEEKQNIGDALALAVGEKLFSSREIKVPSDFENEIFREGNRSGLMNGPSRAWILDGSIDREAEKLKVTSQLQDSQGRVHFNFSSTVEDDAPLFEAADVIARRVAESLAFRRLGGNERSLKDITTAVWPAWMNYTKGKKYFYSGRWDESRWYFKESVLNDPGFALGYQALAETAVICGYPEQAWMLGQKALGWMDRISLRRQLQLKAETYLKSEKYIQKAGDIYLEIIRIYPWDTRARYFQSVLESQTVNRNMGENSPKVLFPWIALAFSAFSLSERLENLCAQIQERDNGFLPGSSFIHSLCCIIKGQNAKAMEHAEAGRSISPSGNFDRLIGDINWLQGELEAARKHYEINLDNLEPAERVWRGFRLGQLALTQGRFRKAKEIWTGTLKVAEKQGLRSWAYRIHCSLARMEISRSRYRSALSFSQQAMNIAAREDARVYPREGLLWQGLGQAGLKQWSDVDRTLSELGKVCRLRPDSSDMRYYYYLNGAIKAAGNILDRALEDFQQAAELVPGQGNPFDFNNDQAFFLNGLAEAMEQTGRIQDAIGIYERLGDLTTGRMGYGDIWALSLYQQGRLFDKMERKEEAKVKYQEFLNYWADADEETWEKDEARRRLSEMKS